MSEWQPIETAPKDETEFLSYCSLSGKQAVCSFRWEAFRTTIYPEWKPEEDEFGRDWATVTHWMPLPAPPEKRTQSEEDILRKYAEDMKKVTDLFYKLLPW